MPVKDPASENFVSYKAFLSILFTAIMILVSILSMVYSNHAGEPHRDAVSREDFQIHRKEVKDAQRELKKDLENDIYEIKSDIKAILNAVMKEK